MDDINEIEETQEPKSEYIEDVAKGVELLKAESDGKWQLGDIAAKYADEIKTGRPKDEDGDEPNLSRLAYDWNVNKSRVSEWRSCAIFYPEKVRVRERYSGLSWYFFNAARTRAAGKVDNAEELLDFAVRQHLGLEEFKAYLKEHFTPDSPADPTPTVIPTEADMPDEAENEVTRAALSGLFSEDFEYPVIEGMTDMLSLPIALSGMAQQFRKDNPDVDSDMRFQVYLVIKPLDEGE